MKIKRVKLNLIIILCGLFIAAIIAAGCVLGGVTAYADEGAGYNESYRNRLAFSAARGWNNDPNGLYLRFLRASTTAKGKKFTI